MTALAFTPDGAHSFALGWIQLRRADARADIVMTVAFPLNCVGGITVLFSAGELTAGLCRLGTGLWLMYFAVLRRL